MDLYQDQDSIVAYNFHCNQDGKGLQLDPRTVYTLTLKFPFHTEDWHAADMSRKKPSLARLIKMLLLATVEEKKVWHFTLIQVVCNTTRCQKCKRLMPSAAQASVPLPQTACQHQLLRAKPSFQLTLCGGEQCGGGCTKRLYHVVKPSVFSKPLPQQKKEPARHSSHGLEVNNSPAESLFCPPHSFAFLKISSDLDAPSQSILWKAVQFDKGKGLGHFWGLRPMNRDFHMQNNGSSRDTKRTTKWMIELHFCNYMFTLHSP